MPHIADGTLRRLYDEPLALSSREREHYAACLRCQSRFALIAGQARETASALARPTLHSDPSTALLRYRQHMAGQMAGVGNAQGTRERIATMIQTQRHRLIKPLGSLAAAGALILALALTPVGSLAQEFLTIFQPSQFAAVPVTTDELQGLPNLSNYGTMKAGSGPTMKAASTAAEAATASGLTVLTPGALPASVPSTINYRVTSGATASFTFSAQKAAATAAATGKPLPPMPTGLDGSTLSVTLGPAVLTTYGLPARSNASETTSKAGEQGASARAGSSSSLLGRLPVLAIGQTPAPRVTSTGASREQIEAYLLAQPGVSPQLASAIKVIGAPNSTLPIPIPINLASGHPVTVQGVQGLAIGDNTGMGSGVMWQKGGIIYVVAGTLPEDQIMAIAQSLH